MEFARSVIKWIDIVDEMKTCGFTESDVRATFDILHDDIEVFDENREFDPVVVDAAIFEAIHQV